MKEITVTADMVLKKLNCLNVNKSAVPDGIQPESSKKLNIKLWMHYA